MCKMGVKISCTIVSICWWLIEMMVMLACWRDTSNPNIDESSMYPTQNAHLCCYMLCKCSKLIGMRRRGGCLSGQSATQSTCYNCWVIFGTVDISILA